MRTTIPKAARGRLLPRLILSTGLAVSLFGCDAASRPGFLGGERGADSDGAVTRAARGGRMVERDIEAPEVFQATESGLWDGRPSLGGVWVAHPDVTEPERVLIRNETNGQFVIGALFKREREMPGPRLQVSSDAAAALEMLAGAPARLNVVALRREEVSEDAPEPVTAPGAPVLAEGIAAPAPVTDAPLDPVAREAEAALARTDSPAPQASAPVPVAAAPPPAAVPAPAATPRPAPQTSSLAKPFIQIGIFSIEQNAQNSAEAMRQAGMVPTVKKQTSQGKTFWRVIVGPAQSRGDLDTLMGKITDIGFTDAYAVSN